MDDIIKLLQQLIDVSPRPKGGIASSQEGIEFLGKALTKEQRGNLTVVGSRLTDASRFKPFSIQTVGRDRRYQYMFDYEQELAGEFNKTINFLKDNPDIRLSQTQKDNVIYNLGVYRRVAAEKNKLEKGIISEGKKPEEIYAAQVDQTPTEELSFGAQLEKFRDTQKKLQKALDDLKGPSKQQLDERALRLKRL